MGKIFASMANRSHEKRIEELLKMTPETPKKRRQETEGKLIHFWILEGAGTAARSGK